MSLILEALRKSEAERRRGLPPDVHAELPPAATARPYRMPTWAWALLAAAVLAAAAWWWLHDRGTPPIASVPATAIDESRVSAEPVPAQTALPARTPAPAPASPPSPASPVVAPSEPPVAVDTPTTAAASPVPRDTPPAALPTPLPGRVPAVTDLDPESRKALPPLRLSMHLWNADPAQRFVIIDGQRLGEGDRVGEATVARIEADGVLLEWRGSQLRLPLR